MTKKKAGNNKFLKKYNESQILNLIRVHNAVSRSELSQITGLSPTAIGIIVSSLIEKCYVSEIGQGESRGGRRPVLLKLRPDSYYSFGVDIDEGYENIMLVDITGKIVYEHSTKHKPPVVFEDVLAQVKYSVDFILDNMKLNTNRLVGMGISVPGLVDVKLGKVVMAPNLGWEDMDIVSDMRKFLNVPVYVENEAKASAIYESWLGACRDEKNFVCINIESGIGAGIFTDGNLYRGVSGSAGEVGHIMVDENGPRCGCGNYGCLETLASIKSVVERAKKIVRQGVQSSLNNLEDIDGISIDSIIEAARAGDKAAKDILLESARYLGIAISNIVNTLNPSKIVIGKEFTRYADIVMEQIKSVVNCKALRFPAANVDIMASEMGKKSSAYGAAIIPLKALFGKY